MLRLKFIALEGIDGTGKSTLVSSMARVHTELFKYVSFPMSGYDIYKNLVTHIKGMKKLLKPDVAKGFNDAVAFAFLSDYLIGDGFISEELKTKNILSDRSFISNLAYQYPLVRPEIYDLIFKSANIFTKPDLVVYLSGDTETCIKRVITRSGNPNNKVDPKAVEYLDQVHLHYMSIMNNFTKESVIIDTTSKSENEVFNEVKELFDKYLSRK